MKDFSQQGNNHSSFRKAAYLYKHFKEGVNKQEQEGRKVEDEFIEDTDLDVLAEVTPEDQTFETVTATQEENLEDEIYEEESSGYEEE
ncbi:hypothetical protein D1953_11975, partial [Peribacillus asahii]